MREDGATEDEIERRIDELLDQDRAEGEDSSEERYLLEALSKLQKSYNQAAKPYVDRLIAIRSIRMPKMTITLELAKSLGLTQGDLK
jgi:hypothetical protein